MINEMNNYEKKVAFNKVNEVISSFFKATYACKDPWFWCAQATLRPKDVIFELSDTKEGEIFRNQASIGLYVIQESKGNIADFGQYYFEDMRARIILQENIKK